MAETQAAYDELYVYTMARPGFILQHVVDAFAMQTATAKTKPIAVVFGLVGLYLRVEEQFSGRQVQKPIWRSAATSETGPPLLAGKSRGHISRRRVGRPTRT